MRKDTQRLFFALDLAHPDNAESKQQIIELKQHLSPLGRPVPNDNLHITLAFLGEVDSQAYRALCDAADKISLPAISTQTTETGQFSKQGIVWLGLDLDDTLNTLAASLQGFAADILIRPTEKRFIPHISLLHRTKVTENLHQLSVPLTFDQFGIYASIPDKSGRDVYYRCLNRWTLTH
ncbi:RNA 2',3'-cyclic phosphodiesterase [Grimontia sp. NTOU-MAR1]|uniref:RNA 2',3'-cyclic phosphodiesterase n=1 Tax=Grimontia sp. NTOU-MAR1 TaxID=3111011 RepID=UPI002DBA7D91|nr:RNA 2',3'-cyclic phosphodiesterase [Grimontia sp. NTOU-MAR1]WRV97106.1 RNA 2',3'-cyclic phosphodiesterase [Grimontia sp. NTOU-MAR1]